MIFGTLKLIIWLAGVVAIAYFALPYVGYRVNLNYWEERKVVCQERIEACQRDLIKSGIEGAKEKCDFRCVDTKSLIEKIERKPATDQSPEKNQE